MLLQQGALMGMNEAGGARELEAFPAGRGGGPPAEPSGAPLSVPPGLLSLDPPGPSLRSRQRQVLVRLCGLPEVLAQ